MTIFIHWITAITVLGLLVLGAWMVDLGYYHTWYYKAPLIHKSVGIILLGIILFRIFWRMFNPTPKSLPSHSSFEKRAAMVVHIFIYLLLLGTMLSGYLIVTAAGKPVAVFGWFEIPAMMKDFKGQADIAGEIHLFLAFSLGGAGLASCPGRVKTPFHRQGRYFVTYDGPDAATL